MLRILRHAGALVVALTGLTTAAPTFVHHHVTATASGTVDEWRLADLAYLEWWSLAIALGSLALGGALALAMARRSRVAWLAAAPSFAVLMIGFAGRAAEFHRNPLVALTGLVIGLFVLFFADGWARERGFFARRGAS